ncbi:MAG TPA: hypothetical protein VE309_12800 [Caulobacteraceae bacterium]|nr:hypothetical protein [Caulobacteraceae bacterium]
MLHYRGHNYPLDVSGITVGTIGAHSYSARGSVYHLHRLRDIEGTYAAGEASATVGVGAGATSMSNGAGVDINAQSTSQGVKLTLGPSGVTIRLR